jgi:hypothetical protein
MVNARFCTKALAQATNWKSGARDPPAAAAAIDVDEDRPIVRLL